MTTPGDPTLLTPSSQVSKLSTNPDLKEAPTDDSPASLAVSQGKSGVLDIQSDTESFVEVSESDIKDEALVKSPSLISDSGSDTLTTVSLTSEASKLEDLSTKNSNNNGYQKPEEKEERSRRYVTEFLEKYVLDSRTDKQVSCSFLN